jgi:S1-C subfamily serine protease
LHIGDVILSIGTRPVHSARDFALGTYRYSIGDTAELSVLRDRTIMTIEVMITEPEDDPERLADMVDPRKNAIPQLGFLGIELNDTVKKILGDVRVKDGVLLAAQSGTSTYVGDELQLGDIIHSLNGHDITSLDDLRSILERQKAGAPIVLQVERDNRLRYVVLEEN